MKTLEVPVDERWLATTGLSPVEAEQEFRLILAAKLFELRRLTLGQAAEMAGLPVGIFMESISRLGVSVINLTEDQLAHEFEPA